MDRADSSKHSQSRARRLVPSPRQFQHTKCCRGKRHCGAPKRSTVPMPGPRTKKRFEDLLLAARLPEKVDPAVPPASLAVDALFLRRKNSTESCAKIMSGLFPALVGETMATNKKSFRLDQIATPPNILPNYAMCPSPALLFFSFFPPPSIVFLT